MTDVRVKLVLNRCFGGFGLSDDAWRWLASKGSELAAGFTEENLTNGTWAPPYDLPRNHPDLVAVVEALGKAASGPYSDLEVAEVVIEIMDYDGVESVRI